MRTQIFILIAGLLALNLMGCTRAAKDDAKLNLTIASSVDGQGALTAGTLLLSHVAINVTGAGIPNPVIYSWDACQDCSTQVATPSSFQVTVPSGTSRLIQVLVVYKDSDTNQMVFYYGDITQDLTTSEVTSSVSVDKVGGGNITSGRVSGRYFTTSTSGPTGLVDIKYNPGNGKQALIVDSGTIVNGWFSMFMLSGANLEYVLRGTPEKIWGQEVSFESAIMDPAESSGAYFDQRVKAYIPIHVEERSENGTTTYKKQDSETHVWGYWGPGATGKKVCTSGLDSSPVPQKLKQYATTNLSSSPALAVSHYINWNLAPPTKAVLTDAATPYGYVVFQGGTSMSSTCGSFADTFANQFTNFQKITLNLIDGNGGDNVAGFRGIFRNNSNNNFASVSSADPKVITGEILPGVEEVFNGLRLFKRRGTDDFRLEIAKCSELGPLDFIPGSGTDAVLNSSGNFSLTSNITAAEGTSGVSAVLCPVKDGVLAPIGVFMSKWNFSSGSSGGMSGPATQVALLAPQKTVASGTIVNYVCTPVTIEARTASGTAGYLPGNVTLNLSSNDGNTAFYEYNSCSTPITTVQTSSSSKTVYVKRSAGGGISKTITVTASNGLGSSTSTIGFIDPPGSLTPKVLVNVPQTISAHECYPVSYQSWNSNLYIASLYDMYTTTFSFTLPSGGGLAFYYTGECTNTPSTSFSLGSNTETTTYMKYTGGATSISVHPTSISPASPILTTDVSGGSNITVLQPGAPSNIDFMASTSFEEGQCQTIKVRSTDSNGRTAPVASSMTVNLATTLSGGTFYQYGGCSTPITSILMNTGVTSQYVYFKTNTTGSGTMTASSSSPVLSNSRNVTVVPATFSQIMIAMPGQSLVGGNIVGAANAIPQSMTVYMDLYLVKYDGQVDTSANGIKLTGGSMSGGTMTPPNTINFVNGVATNVAFMADNSYSSVNVSLQAGSIYGSSTSVSTYAAATMLNLYMSNSGVVAPGGCQIMALIPESTDGASSVMMPTNFTLSASNGGGVYTDRDCSLPANGTYSFNPGDRIMAFFFKQPSNSTSSTVTVAPSNGLISTPLNTTTDSTATGSAYKYLFTGRMTSMKSSVCQPYLVSVADNQGRSVVIGADQSVTLQVTSGGGTVGTFDDSSCDWPYSGAPTSITTSANYATVFLTAMISGSIHILNASGSPLQSTTSSGITPTP